MLIEDKKTNMNIRFLNFSCLWAPRKVPIYFLLLKTISYKNLN
jgi:hypothetical protein